jgi:hypothetical protein
MARTKIQIPWRALVVSTFWAIVAVAYAATGSTEELWRRLTWILLFFLGLAIGAVCHEFGHLLCARLGSIPVYLLSVGRGPVLWRGRIGETRLEVRSLPLSGFVACYPEAAPRKYWIALSLLSGVLANAALIVAAAWMHDMGIVPKPVRDALGPIAFAQLLLIVVNIMPLSFRTKAGIRATDGLQLLQLFCGGPTEAALAYASMLGRYSTVGKVTPTWSATSSRLMYQLSRPDRWTDDEARRDVQAVLQCELSRGELSREEMMLVLDALVTQGLIFGDPALRSRLDDWSLRALQLGPDLQTLLGSRGAVLVELGRYAEAKAILVPLVAAENSEPFDIFLNQFFLARAERALGNVEAAQSLAASARKGAKTIGDFPPAAYMLARLESEFATLIN